MDITIRGLMNKVEFRYKVTFLSTFLIGLFSQGMGLFNKYSIHDDAGLFGTGATYTSGRWLLDWVGRIEQKGFGDGHYSLPIINGGAAILLIALAACLIVSLLDIQNDFLCAFIGGIMVCFPVVTALFGYMFTVHYYMIAMFMGILGAFLVCRYNKWYLLVIGIVLMGASVGIYQAFIPITLSVILLYFINYTIDRSNSILKIVRTMVTLAISALLFFVFYLVMTNIFLKIQHTGLSDYKGINTIGKLSFYEYWLRVQDAYIEFFMPDSSRGYYMYSHSILTAYYIVLIVILIFSLILIWRVGKEDKIRALILLAAIGCVPLATNFVFIMAGKKETHALMVYAQLMVYVLGAWLLDKVKFTKRNIQQAVFSVALFGLGILLLMYCRFDNKCYLSAELSQQEAISYFTTLITRIKSVQDYTDEMPVAFINQREIEDNSVKELWALDDIIMDPYWGINEYLNTYNWNQFVNIWCGYYPVMANYKNYETMPEVINMPHYPDDGSIQIIDDTVVVKF